MPFFARRMKSLGALFAAPAPELAPAADAPCEPPVEDPVQSRVEERQETEVTGRLRLAASEFDCRIADLSTGGMKVLAPDAPISVGEQVSVITQNFPLLAGAVRWIEEGAFGVQFAQPIDQELIEKMGQLRRRVRVPRAMRVGIEIPAMVWFEGKRHHVVVWNVSAGGVMMTTAIEVLPGQRGPIRKGQALMLQFPELMPIGAHVRWTCGDKCGVMFSKLMSVPMAEEIRSLANLSHAWVDDVREAHGLLPPR